MRGNRIFVPIPLVHFTWIKICKLTTRHQFINIIAIQAVYGLCVWESKKGYESRVETAKVFCSFNTSRFDWFESSFVCCIGRFDERYIFDHFDPKKVQFVYFCVCVCLCVCARERESVRRIVWAYAVNRRKRKKKDGFGCRLVYSYCFREIVHFSSKFSVARIWFVCERCVCVCVHGIWFCAIKTSVSCGYACVCSCGCVCVCGCCAEGLICLDNQYFVYSVMYECAMWLQLQLLDSNK